MKHCPVRLAKIAAVLALVSPALPALPAAAAQESSAQAATAAATACPTPFPVAEVTDGMSGWGLTVSKGTTPLPFIISVQGVLTDGIAPGIDMILAEARSTAIDKAGSIWAGMSGSPVYAWNGKLIGAVSYGFSGSSKLAGITPAQAMLDIWNRPEAARTLTARKRVTLPQTLQRKLTTRRLATTKTAAQGLALLPLAHGVSGVSQQRINTINERAARQGSDIRLRKMAATAGAPAPASQAIAGGNFGALLSYGTVTLGALGTTTAVCDGRALAFGHPAYGPGGNVRLVAVSGTAVSIVQDPVGGPYKLADPGGIIGTLTQDRYAGVSANLGAGPPVTPIVARSTSGGATRTDTTYVARTKDVPELAGYHLWASLDRARDEIAGGSVNTSWRVRGTADGTPWEVTLADRYTSQDDATGDIAWDIMDSLYTLYSNPYSKVGFTDVQITSEANEVFSRHTVSRLLVQTEDGWVVHDPQQHLQLKAGEDMLFRVRLAGYQAPARDVEMRIRVPEEAAGGYGVLSLVGGQSRQFDVWENVDDFSELITRIGQSPRNDVLYADLVVYNVQMTKVTTSVRLDTVINGQLDINYTAE